MAWRGIRHRGASSSRPPAARTRGPVAQMCAHVPPTNSSKQPALVCGRVQGDLGILPSWHARRSTTVATTGRARSEEHTSELQSRVELVCRLLLEKQNKWLIR